MQMSSNQRYPAAIGYLINLFGSLIVNSIFSAVKQMPGGVLITLSHICRKACHIAQLVRIDPTLLAMLVDEKVGPEKNSRFNEDFKTLVDVLIQEIVRVELENKVSLIKLKLLTKTIHSVFFVVC